MKSVVRIGKHQAHIHSHQPRDIDRHLLFDLIEAQPITSTAAWQRATRAQYPLFALPNPPLLPSCTSNAYTMANSILLHEERFPSKTDGKVNAFGEPIHTGHLLNLGNEGRLVSFTHVLEFQRA